MTSVVVTVVQLVFGESLINAIGLRSANRWRVLPVVVACLTLSACVRFHGSRSVPDLNERLRFTNATPDHVTVYLALPGTRPWRLGDVDAFRTSVLPLRLTGQNGTTARLLVLPLGASRTGRSSTADIEAAAWSSLSEPTEDISNMRWTLVGHQLFSEPFRRRR